MKDLVKKKGVLGWFVENHVAANLLMMFIVVSGFISLSKIKIEVFPEFSLDTITVSVPYRGATPSDVEEGVLLRIEEAVAGIDGVKEITSTAVEGAGTVVIEVEDYANTSEVLDDVKAEIDRIITFPQEIEKPIIAEVKTRTQVITIVIYGDAPERTLKQYADDIRDELTAFDNISQVDLAGVRPYEISIEVSEKTLQKLGINFDDVSSAIARSSLDLPAGAVQTSGGDILIRTQAQKYIGKEFEKIIVISSQDGTKIPLSSIAEVKDDFEDIDLLSKFDGKPAAQIQVYRVGEQGALDIADTVKKYVQSKQQSLPDGINIALWQDNSSILKSRIELLLKNARMGLVLVFICLLLFLNLKLAFWTTIGIPISFLGAFYLMPMFDVSVNMISLFAFIMSLGIVVDDAIVVGENIYSYRQKGMTNLEASIKGVKEMAAPVTMSVLTTMVAFAPMLFISGVMGKFFKVIPLVVISVFGLSLIEALLILPAHLSSKDRFKKNFAVRITDKINFYTESVLQSFVNGKFAQFVSLCVKYRYATISASIMVLLISVGFIVGGRLKFVFFDSIEADNIIATLNMPQGTPFEQTLKVVERLENAAEQMRVEFDAQKLHKTSVVKHISTVVGAQPNAGRGGPRGNTGSYPNGAHLALINIELIDGENRKVSSNLMRNRWREITGEIPGVSSLTFKAELFSSGEAINVELSHQDFDTLLAAAEELKSILPTYNGTSDIADSFEEGKAEMKIDLKDSARTLGLTLSDLARQVRQGFYGNEVQRIQRGRDDIRVMVRYSKEQRASIADVENMRIRLPNGTQIPFKTVADVKYGRSYAAINRIDRRRVVNVTADVDEVLANSAEINANLYSTVLPKLAAKYSGLFYRPAGQNKERNESLSSLLYSFPLALFAIYALLAVQLKSYIQPIIIMTAIPFGITGAIIGHLITGYNIGLLSMFGIVALSGVVVNDSIIMIDLINRERQEGIGLRQLLVDCATKRFRAIMLTTITTFFGLVPMMAERSLQARFLIPMAISLAFGVLFATSITLLLVPSLYMILEDFKAFVLRKTDISL